MRRRDGIRETLRSIDSAHKAIYFNSPLTDGDVFNRQEIQAIADFARSYV